MMLHKLKFFSTHTLIVFMGTLLAACGSSRKVGSVSDINRDNSASNLKYSITYLIHGDANYLYHDSLGIAHQADGKVLKEAKRVARQAKSGEVFIFHQRPEKKILWLFPKKDRHFYHFKNGKLIDKQSYSPTSNAGVFAAESRLYHRHKSKIAPDRKNILLYFGHEIPHKNGTGYFKSIPELVFNTQTFAKGLKKMLATSADSFDFTVLSTCNNGSPDMVNALQPFTDYLLASPQNLHLSHIDTESLLQLEGNSEISSGELAAKVAEQTVQRLKQSVQTVISLSIYDMQKVDSFIHQADSAYNTYLKKQSSSKPGADNTDCATLPVFKSNMSFSKGVTSWYRPPRFGRKADKKTHSGWGCKE